MEFATQKIIKRTETWTLDLPNLKEYCYVPNKIEFWVSTSTTSSSTTSTSSSGAATASTTTSTATSTSPSNSNNSTPLSSQASAVDTTKTSTAKNLIPGCGDTEVSLYSGRDCLYKWGISYFKIYNFIDLSLYLNKIGEGDNISVQIKNMDREEKELTLKIIYREYQGNIIYCNSYDSSLIQTETSNPLHDLAAVGLVTNIQIQTEVKMQGVLIEPIFHLKEADSSRIKGFPTGSICVEADEPTANIEIALEQLQEYQNAMKYFRMRILWDPAADVKETRKSKIHIVAHGFKNN
jgi:hypothetical protein